MSSAKRGSRQNRDTDRTDGKGTAVSQECRRPSGPQRTALSRLPGSKNDREEQRNDQHPPPGPLVGHSNLDEQRRRPAVVAPAQLGRTTPAHSGMTATAAAAAANKSPAKAAPAPRVGSPGSPIRLRSIIVEPW